MRILVTGGAGFIGFHTSKALLDKGYEVISIDDFNDYYDVQLKEDRASILLENPNFKLYRGDICDKSFLDAIFSENKIDKICHLAARAGVRASLINPFIYEKVNIGGTMNILEMAKKYKIKKIVSASSSSVYGGNKKVPFEESDKVDNPISPYAATKRAGELIAYTYHHLYGLNIACLRFFTVYGPWGRPDMALFKFTKAICENKAIDVYNFGNMQRDFTYIDDIVKGILACLDVEIKYEIINLGNNKSEKLIDFIKIIEKKIGKEAKKNFLPLQDGDVLQTYANIDKAKNLLNYEPKTNIKEGISSFIKWYKDYYK